MKRVAAGAHFPTPRLFEPAKRPDDRTDYCLVVGDFIYILHRVAFLMKSYLVVKLLLNSGIKPGLKFNGGCT